MAKWREVKQGKIPKTRSTSVNSSPLENPNMAPLLVRLKSFLTDTFLLTTPILYIVIYLLMGSGEEFAQNRSAGWGLIFLFHFTLISFFWFVKAQTPGMKAYDIKLINNKNQNKTSFFQIIVRYVATLLAIISIFVLFLPYFRKDRRTFQDIVSNTHISFE